MGTPAHHCVGHSSASSPAEGPLCCPRIQHPEHCLLSLHPQAPSRMEGQVRTASQELLSTKKCSCSGALACIGIAGW